MLHYFPYYLPFLWSFRTICEYSVITVKQVDLFTNFYLLDDVNTSVEQVVVLFVVWFIVWSSMHNTFWLRDLDYKKPKQVHFVSIKIIKHVPMMPLLSRNSVTVKLKCYGQIPAMNTSFKHFDSRSLLWPQLPKKGICEEFNCTVHLYIYLSQTKGETISYIFAYLSLLRWIS